MGLFKKKPHPSQQHVQPVQPVQLVQPVANMPARPPHTMSVSAWDGARFKIQLRMARTRVEVQRTKRENSIVSNRRTAAEHLRAGKEELARIFAEKTLRDRAQRESFDVAMTYVELLIESSLFVGNIRDFDSAPPDVKESVASLVYSAQRMSIQELYVASQMLRDHFGATVIDPIARGEDGPHLYCVNSLLAVKLDSTSPDPALVREELIRIANEFSIDWTAPPDTYGSAQHMYSAPADSNFGPTAPPHPPPDDYYGPPPHHPPPPGGSGGYGMGDPYAVSHIPTVPSSNSSPYVPPTAPMAPPPLPPPRSPPPRATRSFMDEMPPSAPPSAPPSDPPSAPPSAPSSDVSFNALTARFNKLNRDK